MCSDGKKSVSSMTKFLCWIGLHDYKWKLEQFKLSYSDAKVLKNCGTCVYCGYTKIVDPEP